MEIRPLAPFGAEVVGTTFSAAGAEIGRVIARHRVLHRGMTIGEVPIPV